MNANAIQNIQIGDSDMSIDVGTSPRPAMERADAGTAPLTAARVPPSLGGSEDPPRSLWRNWRFQLLWVGSGTAFLGLAAADFAYPLVILLMTRSPAMAGLFGFIQMTAGIVAGLPAGVLVDRWDRRRTLIAAEATRALATGSIAVAWAMGHLTLAHLFAVAAVLGAVSPFGAAARMLMVRAVVPKQQLTKALTQDEVRTAATGMAGPPLGGALLAAGRALPFLVCSLTFVVSLLTALVVRVPATPPPAATPSGGAPAPGHGGMFAGVRTLWANRTMRAALMMISLINVGGTALFLSVIVLLQSEGTSARGIGVAVAGEAVGTLLGAGLVGRLHRRVAPGALLIILGGLFTALTPLLAVPWGPWWVFAVIGVSVLGVPAMKILIDVLIFRQVPDEQRGRVITAVMTVLTVGIPLGTLAGGVCLQFYGPTATILAIGALNAVALAVGAADRRLRAARWPAA